MNTLDSHFTKKEFGKGLNEDAIRDYVNGDLTVVDIAKKYQISVSELSSWLRKARISRRRRGRRPLSQPTDHSQNILVYAAARGFSSAAKRYNVSRQRISALAKRWGVSARRRTTQSTDKKPKLADQERRRPRGAVICFRLSDYELSMLRTTFPEHVVLSTKSIHSLARAAILARFDKSAKSQTEIADNQSSPAS